MIDTKAIRNKILDLAVRGKLTEQLSEDGTAEELFRKIQAEKQALIKAGKIKKEKPLPEINEGDIPFEIPKKWMWVRIGTVLTLQAGKNMTASEIKAVQDNNHIIPCYGGNGQRGFVNQANIDGFHAIIGRQGALCGNINFAEGPFYATEHAVVVYGYAGTDMKWAGITLRYLNLNQYATSVAQPGLAVSTIDNVLIPLPPPAEQKRIVEKVEQVFSVLETIDELQKKYEDNINALRSRIIEIGLKGQLSKREQSDGTPTNLITSSNNRHMNDIPFEIPDEWIWTSIEEVATNIGKKTDQIFSNEVEESGKYPAISQGEKLIDGYTDEEKAISDVPVLVFGDHTRNVKYVDFPFVICADGTKCLKVNKANPRYIYYWMKYAATKIEDRGYARHYSLLKKYPLPFPSLAEQKRIVGLLDNIMAILG